jgi:hypothetical protein
MDPSMMDIHIRNPMTNRNASQDNNMKIRDIGVVANYHYLHSMCYHFDPNIAALVHKKARRLLMRQIACSNLGRESPSILMAEEV